MWNLAVLNDVLSDADEESKSLSTNIFYIETMVGLLVNRLWRKSKEISMSYGKYDGRSKMVSSTYQNI